MHTCSRCGHAFHVQQHRPAELGLESLFARDNTPATWREDGWLLDQVVCPVCGQHDVSDAIRLFGIIPLRHLRWIGFALFCLLLAMWHFV